MLNVVIPAAGFGNRFKEAGYNLPKPIIDVAGKPMIERVVKSLGFGERAQYIYLFQKSHLEQYDIYSLLNKITPRCIIIPLEGVTDGAARTVLLAKQYIDNENPLVIANSDQIVKFNYCDFFTKLTYDDGVSLVFMPQPNSPKWSYVNMGGNYNRIYKVTEKEIISDWANCGVYGFQEGHSFIIGAESMIEKNIRTNDEFYIAPVYNELINKGHYIVGQEAQKMLPCGTPYDLEETIRIIQSEG